MRPDQTLVAFQREGPHVTARTSGPLIPEDAAGIPKREHLYSHLTTPLRQRGQACTVEYGLSDYIVHAELPDGTSLVISPPQEPAADHEPGYPESWLVTRSHPEDSALHEVLYNSEPGGPHARYGGNVPRLLAAIDARLDQLGLPPRPAPGQSAQHTAAESVLHRAGFIPVVTYRDSYHRLPLRMTDVSEQRQAVTRAFDALRTEGFDVSCDPDLLDPGRPYPPGQGMSLGDRLGHITRSVAHAGHTAEAVAALSELTAPGDGVLHRITEVLEETADWWEGLGAATDPLYAARLRRIVGNLEVSALEIRSLRGELADRHTDHPLRVHVERVTSQEMGAPRVVAALSVSPTTRRTRPAALPTAPAALPALPPARPASAPGR